MSRLAPPDFFRLASRHFMPVLLALGAGCRSESLLTDRFPTVSMTPPRAVLTVGDTVTLQTASEGRSPCACDWSISDAAVVAVSSKGLVRALSPGQAIVTATLARDANIRVSALIDVAAR